MTICKSLSAIISAATFIGLAASAQAADLPAAVRPAYKAPAMMQPLPYNWTGFYIGGNAGYGWAHANADLTGPTGVTGNSLSEDLNGGIFGAQAGYNWQFGQWVVGLETDIQGTSQKASQTTTCSAATCGTAVTLTRDSKLPWFGTTRARLGYAVDRWMPFVTAGVAYGEHTIDLTGTTATGSAQASTSETKAGFVVGGGVEVAFAPRWSAKIEYLYIDSGTVTTSATVAGFGTVTADERLKNNVLRGGVNYHF
jgi:outer membrane immunogenic protein